MCYAGCRYELTWGEGAGECSLPNGEKPPRDAMCSVNDIEAETAKLRELAKEMYCVISENNILWDFRCDETKAFHCQLRKLGIEVGE